MYLIREVFKTRPGKAKEIVKIFKQVSEKPGSMPFKNMRIMTDLVTDYWTVVVQYEVELLDEFSRNSRNFTSSPEMAHIFQGYLESMDSGRREIYLLEN